MTKQQPKKKSLKSAALSLEDNKTDLKQQQSQDEKEENKGQAEATEKKTNETMTDETVTNKNEKKTDELEEKFKNKYGKDSEYRDEKREHVIIYKSVKDKMVKASRTLDIPLEKLNSNILKEWIERNRDKLNEIEDSKKGF